MNRRGYFRVRRFAAKPPSAHKTWPVTSSEALSLKEYGRSIEGLQTAVAPVIDHLAASVYRGRERFARDLVKNKRFDQAIKAYREVIEKFGIDLYLRKAQREISRIEDLKKKSKG